MTKPHPIARVPGRLALVTWGVIVIGLHGLLEGYSARPGELGNYSSPGDPGHLGASRAGERSAAAAAGPTLTLFAHPRCPCTRASLEQLDRLVALAGRDALRVRIAFYRPAGSDPSFAATDLRDHASRIPGAIVLDDVGGELAKRHDARTSGLVLIDDGELGERFRGGITAARGHAGDSRGSAAVLALARGEVAADALAPVFGCDLLGESPP
jgi:hypothetical protein